MIEGTKLQLGGQELVVPPLTLKALRRLNAKLKSLASLGRELPSDDQIETIIEVVHTAVVRNHPEVTKEQLEEWLDVGNMAEVLKAVFTVSGLERRKGSPGEA
jgi:hypothetical protein